MAKYSIAVIKGDGIGPEVIDEALKVLALVGQIYGMDIFCEEFPFGAGYYLEHKEVLPKSAFDDLGAHQAILLGAIGDPRVPMGPLEQELLLALRFHFDQYMNLRPAKSWPGVSQPLILPEGRDIDILVVRENTEDFYMNLGGSFEGTTSKNFQLSRSLYQGKIALNIELDPKRKAAYSLGMLSYEGTRRISLKAFQFAIGRGESFIHVATKSNALPHIYGFWDEVVAKCQGDFPSLDARRMNVDNLAYQLARNPQNFGVILCPNLFGDIISDLTAGLIGGLGLAPSGNIGESLSMFEPVHGSAPDIKGTGRANPLAAILSVALMLSHLGEPLAAKTIEMAVGNYLSQSPKPAFPKELGGDADTRKVGELVLAEIKKLPPIA
ncbi:MAG: isocitrate/isopropylmalate dehydrogenase family protein [Deltaproteobacteria bacterium]|jgi:3-isopropylmalate dehydrogenase|nr:isocitrate/isopropylmalate dehydrogenase family protein [Deltaproteobacteria bacterium]